MTHAYRKKVLIVADEPAVQDFLVTCVEKAGFKVESANDGVDALEKIEANVPDLITLDVTMPRKSGINLIRKLRKNEKWAGIPVIVIIMNDHDAFESEDIKEFKTIASRYRQMTILEHPVEPERLVKAICEIFKVAPNPN